FIREKGVTISDKKVNKPAFKIQPHHSVELDEGEVLKYSKSVGYRKLEKIASSTVFPAFTTSDRCLDLGANVGGFSLYMLEQGVASVFAIEISSQYEPYLKRIKDKWPNFSYRIMNFFDMGIDDFPDTYNVITADLTLDPRFLVQNLAKLVQPSRIPARFLITVKLGKIKDSAALLTDIERSIRTFLPESSLNWLESLPDKQELVLLVIIA
ncbi:MAG: SAM-dependent methyltransferase, partial [Candidatus Odinarchaeota archaeon]